MMVRLSAARSKGVMVARRGRPVPSRPVERKTVQDRVYRQLVGMILDGEIEPGRTVTITALAEAFGVSTMPVREAMHRLTAAKALTVVASRSLGVPPLTAERLLALTRVRVEVESLAVAWAAPSVNAAMLARLDALMERMARCRAAGDKKTYLPANRAFHFMVYEASGSAVLLAIIETLWLQIGPYFSLLRPDNWQISNRQHRAVRDALARGDGEAAGAALRVDIEKTADDLDRVLKA